MTTQMTAASLFFLTLGGMGVGVWVSIYLMRISYKTPPTTLDHLWRAAFMLLVSIIIVSIVQLFALHPRR